jgi:hypothetical protein
MLLMPPRTVRRFELVAFHQGADLLQHLLGHRLGALAAELEPVVASRVVAGGDHHAGIETLLRQCVVQDRGADLADVHHLHPLVPQAAGQGLEQHVTAGAVVAAHHETAGPEEVGGGTPDAPGQVLVQFLGHKAADVIRLEDGHAQVLCCLPA